AAEAETKILHELPETPSQRLAKRAGEGDPPRDWSRLLKGELDAIVLTCLRKAPGERYRSVDDLITDLQAWLDGKPVQARGGHGWYRTRKFIGRHRWSVGAATAAAIALLASSVITYLQSIEAKAQRDAAEAALADAQQQRDRAQHVTQFLIDAFAAANPGGELGKDVKARDILDRGAKQLETELTEQPELKAQLLATIAEAQLALSLANEAATTAMSAELLIEKGVESRGIEFQLARIQGRSALAQRLLPEVAIQLERMESLQSTELERAMFGALKISYLYDMSLQIELLEFGQRFVTELSPAVPMLSPPDDFYRGLISYATMLSIRGRSEDAIALLNDAKKLMAAHPASTKSIDVSIEGGLGVAYRRNGRNEEAVVYAENARAMAIEYFGLDSSEHARSLSALGLAMKTSGRFDEAADAISGQVRIYQKIYGESSPRLMTPLFNLGAIFLVAGDEVRAISALRDSVRLAELHLPPDSKSLFTFRVHLAQAIRAKGDCKESEQLLNVAEEGFRMSPEFGGSESAGLMLNIREQCKSVSPSSEES
ncbi:MAG: tetratricopeptide repeat protein, partial [Xanthomonadales bacterium]|nr:tetratricopeptide repeat protein [Xanthomonadales bacterium]